MPWFLLLTYSIASVLSLALYAVDKSAAQGQRRRISENSLHALSLAGGWPGALLAQRMLHHKTRKTSFQAVFWLTVVLNLVALFWYAAADHSLISFPA